jgi:hypothetical protein
LLVAWWAARRLGVSAATLRNRLLPALLRLVGLRVRADEAIAADAALEIASADRLTVAAVATLTAGRVRAEVAWPALAIERGSGTPDGAAALRIRPEARQRPRWWRPMTVRASVNPSETQR